MKIPHFGCLTLVAGLACTQMAQAAPSGAIFTTISNGTIVNANTQYASKCDVYLDGGPGPNAPAHAAGLPAGDYFFQVTDPSGKTLLSTDPVSNRRFTVSASGVITAYTGSGGPAHPIGSDQDHPEFGAITIRLANLSCPTDFANSPNQGGVYKVWATKVGDFVGNPALVDSPSNGSFHGFVSSKSKTDDFKASPTQATYCVSVSKILQAEDGSQTPGSSWEIRVADSLGVINTFFTNDQGNLSVCDLTSGAYSITEIGRDGYGIHDLTVNGLSLPPDIIYSFNLGTGQPPPVIVFTNALEGAPQ
jgi:hypothetical protein